METLSDTTTDPMGVLPEVSALGAEQEAAVRERLIRQVEVLLRESGHSEAFDAAALGRALVAPSQPCSRWGRP